VIYVHECHANLMMLVASKKSHMMQSCPATLCDDVHALHACCGATLTAGMLATPGQLRTLNSVSTCSLKRVKMSGMSCKPCW
jgi:hypothetical protein